MIVLYLLPVIAAGLIYFSSSLDDSTVTQDKKNLVPTIYDNLFISYGKTCGVDWKMLKRISWVESKTGTYKSVALGLRTPANVKDSVSDDGKSWGIMQVTLTTAKTYDPLATPQKLNDPAYSIMIAAKHFAFLKRTYPTFSERDLVMSYNHGQGNQLKFIAKEKSGTLLLTDYPAAREYWKRYQSAKELIP